MYELLIYNLKVGACLAVFWLFFRLLLSRETFHRFNRVVLLGGMAVSFLLPLCVITLRRELPSLSADQFTVPLSAAPMQQTNGAFPVREVVGVLFLTGVAATLLWRLGALAAVWRLIRRGRRERLDDGLWLVHVSQSVAPFSWGRFVVLSEREPAANRPSILTHEQAHVRLHHTVDLLLADLVGCLQWFNPAMWLLRCELRAIHEYEADEAVLKSGVDPRSYQMLLIREAAGGRWYSAANSLHHSKLKNRITMMLRKKSSRRAEARVLLLLPLVGLALGAFAQTRYVVSEEQPVNGEMKLRIEEGLPVASEIEGRPLILVDGIPFEGDLRTIDPQRIEQVMVYKEPIPEAYRRFVGPDNHGLILVETRREAAAAAEPTVRPVSASSTETTHSDVESSAGVRDRAPVEYNTVLGAKGGMEVTGPEVMSKSRTGDGRWTTIARGRVTADFSQIDEADYRIEIDGKSATKADLERIQPGKIRRVELIRTHEVPGRQGLVRVRTRK